MEISIQKHPPYQPSWLDRNSSFCKAGHAENQKSSPDDKEFLSASGLLFGQILLAFMGRFLLAAVLLLFFSKW